MEVEAWLARAARARPERTALATPRGDWSYARLHAAARAGAGELAQRGARRGERVAIALPAGPEFAQALHACLLLGAVAVPVDLRLSGGERAQVAAGAGVVVEEPLREHGRDADAARPGGETHELDAVALVIHTSGTSAAPRPVELTYGNLLWSALGSAVALGLDPDERWLCTLPLSHVGGLSILVRSAIYATTAVLHERFESERALDALARGEATLVSLVATTLARLLDAGLERPPALRCALTGGGPVPEPLLARARAAGVPVSLTYGLTESCSQATTTPVAALADAAAAPGADAAAAPEADAPAAPDAGPPLFCTQLRIAPASAAEGDGEILLRGPTIAPGSLAGDGWLHTGDLGTLDRAGRLRVSGRKADTIVSGGENVAPAEVEAVLEGHPAVLEAAVVGRPDERWGEAVTAWVVVRPDAELDLGEVRALCAERLAPYKVPKEFTLSERPLPRTRSGKLLRRELR
ncbi:MAG TPA: AMP-binding protein [Solirubrobacteraceae bacterium]|nr:AMP-binding protein [Solirubrobacteraceae bacterium]